MTAEQRVTSAVVAVVVLVVAVVVVIVVAVLVVAALFVADNFSTKWLSKMRFLSYFLLGTRRTILFSIVQSPDSENGLRSASKYSMPAYAVNLLYSHC